MNSEGKTGDDSCSYSTSESISCRRVDEGGKAYRECLRTRERLRCCLGRSPEVMESTSVTTMEEVPVSITPPLPCTDPFLPSIPSGAFSWGDRSQQPSTASPIDQSPGWHSSTWSFSFPFPFGYEPPATQQAPTPFPFPPRHPEGTSTAGADDLADMFQHLMETAEVSAKAAMKQLGDELEEFRPFRGLHKIFGGDFEDRRDGSAAAAASEQASPSETHNGEGSGAGGRQRGAGASSRRWGQRNTYDEFSKDFEEV